MTCMPREVRKGLGRSGLVRGEALGDTEGDIVVLSVGSRGESGTFHKLASSGRSSSRSSYSSSSSFIDLRLGCHEPRLVGSCLMSREGARPGLLGDDGLGMGLGTGESVFGDGDRERLWLLIAVIANDGVDGLLNPRLGPELFPLGRISECGGPCPLIGPCSLGNGRPFPAFVRSRMVVVATALPLGPAVLVATLRGRGRDGFSMYELFS